MSAHFGPRFQPDKKYPPNEDPSRAALWDFAATPGETIPAGTWFVEKWSNGHYAWPQRVSIEILSTDNIGPTFTCERRVLVPAQENPRPLTPDAITAEQVEQGGDPGVDYEAMWWKAERELEQLRAAQSRPLTPDDITDEMVERARREWVRNGGRDYRHLPIDLGYALRAALTEPPPRPEGAEEIERFLASLDYLTDRETGGSLVDEATLANDLAAWREKGGAA